MSDDGYVRVIHYGTASDPHERYMPSNDGPEKVVPADAVVIARSELPLVLPEVRASFLGEVQTGNLTVEGLTYSSYTADSHRKAALISLAVAEHLTAHPPVDEVQVEALATALDYHCDLTSAKADLVARRLVELGWTKPEPTP